MSRESLVFLISGTFFGLLVGWILGSQQPGGRSVSPAPVAQTASADSAAQQPLDIQRVQALEQTARTRPDDAAPRVQLGNLYFDAGRFDQAITWYEEALRIDPRDPNVSTDLGVSYYYTNQPDRALQQFDHSLAVDPRHTKTMLNMGIVRAFGKQDLEGAAEAWEQVVKLAPNSPEGQAAKQALDNLRAAHPPAGAAAPQGG